jgi:hypothetical protein
MSDGALNAIIKNNKFINVEHENIRLDIAYDMDEYFFPPEPEPDEEE